MKDETRHSYRFKAFRLEVEERQLLHHNHNIALTPKAFDVLAVLVERSGHLVEKDELLRTVWSDSFVEEANIARVIHTLRKTLGDDGNGNKFIETVPKKGYRFVAEVREFCDSAAAAKTPVNGKPPPPAAKNFILSRGAPSEQIADAGNSSVSGQFVQPAETARAFPRLMIFAAGFVSAILLFVFLLVEIDVTPVSEISRLKKKSIAVLPLKPISAADRNELYETALADSMIYRLGTIKGFVVKPLSETRQYAQLERDPLAAGREQQVDFVLASNYQLAGDKIRITARLFNVATGQIEETYQSEKDATDIFVTQAAITSEVGNLLQTRLANSVSADSAAEIEKPRPTP